MCRDIARTAHPLIRRHQGLDDGQVLPGLDFLAEVVIDRPFLLIGEVTEEPVEELEPLDLVPQEGVAAGAGDPVMEPTVDRAGLRDRGGPVAAPRRDQSR